MIDKIVIENWYEEGYSVVSDIESLEGYVLLEHNSDRIVIYGMEGDKKEIRMFPEDSSAYLSNGVVHIEKMKPVYAYTEYMGS